MRSNLLLMHGFVEQKQQAPSVQKQEQSAPIPIEDAPADPLMQQSGSGPKCSSPAPMPPDTTATSKSPDRELFPGSLDETLVAETPKASPLTPTSSDAVPSDNFLEEAQELLNELIGNPVMIGFQKQLEDALQSVKQVNGAPKRNYRCVRHLMTLIDVTEKVKQVVEGERGLAC